MSRDTGTDSSLGERMISVEIRAVVGEFAARAGRIPGLIAAVLYGSAVRGKLHHKSDLDVFLLFDLPHNPELGEEARLAQEIGGEAVLRTGCPYSFSFVISNVDDLAKMDPDYLWNVAKEGIVIWGQPEYLWNVSSLPLAPYLLISYSLRGLSDKDKRAVHRALYGYRTVKKVGKRVYESTKSGLVQRPCLRLANGVIFAPASKADEILALLRGRGAQVRETRVWYYRE